MVKSDEETQISIVVPTLNEADSISFVLRDLENLSRIYPNLEIVIVDSSSFDGTPEIVNELSIRNPNIKLISVKHMGYGAALVEGMKRVKGGIIVTFDGDGDFAAMDIPKLIQPLLKAQADLVLGSRYLGEIRPGSISLLHKFGNKLLSLLFRLLFGIKISDSQTTLKALTKATFVKVQPQGLDFSISTELVSKAIRAGLRIMEVPVTYRPRFVSYSRVSIWRNLLHILFKLIRGGSLS